MICRANELFLYMVPPFSYIIFDLIQTHFPKYPTYPDLFHKNITEKLLNNSHN